MYSNNQTKVTEFNELIEKAYNKLVEIINDDEFNEVNIRNIDITKRRFGYNEVVLPYLKRKELIDNDSKKTLVELDFKICQLNNELYKKQYRIQESKRLLAAIEELKREYSELQIKQESIEKKLNAKEQEFTNTKQYNEALKAAEAAGSIVTQKQNDQVLNTLEKEVQQLKMDLERVQKKERDTQLKESELLRDYQALNGVDDRLDR